MMQRGWVREAIEKAIKVVVMLFLKCSYILEIDTEIFKDEMT